MTGGGDAFPPGCADPCGKNWINLGSIVKGKILKGPIFAGNSITRLFLISSDSRLRITSNGETRFIITAAANRPAWLSVFIFSLHRARWVETVFSVMPSSPPVSLSVLPKKWHRNTVCWRAERPFDRTRMSLSARWPRAQMCSGYQGRPRATLAQRRSSSV